MLIDIHNHSLYGVDDGAKSLEESVALLQEAHRQGIEAIVLTPHYRHGMFPYPTEQIEANYQELRKHAAGIGISIYLGCEYHVDSEIEELFRSGKCHTLAEGDYILTEYSGQSEYYDIQKYTKKLLLNGYLPVIAHVERYSCLVRNPARCVELSDMGAMIQVNAGSVLGADGWATQRFVKKLLKNGWADVVASDTHDLHRRKNQMAECHAYVTKKYGEACAKRLFVRSPMKILHAQIG